MKINTSEKRSFEFWSIWEFLKGRKKLVVTLVGMLCVQFTLNPELTGLLAGGAVFEGIWALIEYFFKQVEVK